MTTFESLSTSQKLRASIHRDVRAICTEALHHLGMEMTKPAMEIVAELVYRKLSLYGTDVEAFAKHAKRNTVNSEDVKLLVRRNPSLKAHLNSIQPSNPLVKDKRRKTVASSSSATKLLTTPLTKAKETRPNTESKKDGDKRNTNDLRNVLDVNNKETGEGKDLGESRISEGSKGDDSIEKRSSEVEQMSIEDTIDLTFD